MTYKDSLHNFHSAILDAKPKLAEDVINSPVRSNKEERVKIYIEGYYLRITESLMDVYSAFTAKTGFEQARRTFADFLRKNPSPSYNLDTHCISFSDHFEKTPGDKKLRELVKLESEILKNHFRPDSKAITPEKLAALSPEEFANLKLQQRDESILLEFDHDVETYYQNHETSPEAEIEKIPVKVFIFRNSEYQQKRHLLKPAEAEFLKLLFASNDIDSAITKFSAQFPEHQQELEQDFQKWFSKWVQNGFFRE